MQSIHNFRKRDEFLIKKKFDWRVDCVFSDLYCYYYSKMYDFVRFSRSRSFAREGERNQ